MTQVGTGTSDRQLLTLADVARLARVQRPVASGWRSRTRDSDHPFPSPADSDAGRMLFDGGEVAGWLRDTGHGNNRTPDLDLAAHAMWRGPGDATPGDGTPGAAGPGDATPGDAGTGAALSALLCVKAVSGRVLADLDPDDLLDLADEIDPDDEFVLADLEAVRPRLAGLALRADRLADASFTAGAALERLVRAERRTSSVGAGGLRPSVLRLVARLAVDMTAEEGPPAAFVDPSASTELLLTVAAEWADRGPFAVLTPDDVTGGGRLARRRLAAAGVPRRRATLVDDPAFGPGRSVVHLACLPVAGRPGASATELLDVIDELVLRIGPGQRGVVLAPAGVLVDRLTDPGADSRRAALLRAGHVHAVVRLPKALVTRSPRQALALWLLGPADHAVSAADRFTTVGDLANEALTDQVADALVDDLAAAIGGRELARVHAFRFTRPVPTRLLLTAAGTLVEAGQSAAGTRRRPAADLLVEIDRLRSAVAASAPVTALPACEAADPAVRHPLPRTIGELLTDGHLRVLAGNRVAAADVRTGGEGVQVLGVEELTGAAPAGSRTVDRLRLAAHYDAVRLTEPGDVVFCTAPRPAAVVDREGASVVPFPARVLRIDRADPGGLVADVLAADVSAMPEAAREWRRFRVRRVPDAQRPSTTAALRDLNMAAEAARRRVADLDALMCLVTDGVTSGSLTIAQLDEIPTKGR